MQIPWLKVWRDLVQNKARTLLVILSTAVSVCALGLVFGMAGTMRVRMAESQRETMTAHITLRGGPFTQDALEAVEQEPDVLAVEGETWEVFQWKLPGEEEWRDGNLVARDDFEAQSMELLTLLDGQWPEDRSLGVERLASGYFDVSPGTNILVNMGTREREVSVSSVVRMHMVMPPLWGGDAVFFAMPEDVTWLTGREGFNTLFVRLGSFDQDQAEDVAEQIEDRLLAMGVYVSGYEIKDPNVHWQQGMIDGTMYVLMALGVLSLGLSTFLIINTMNSIIAQQVWQIGVMKTVGATFGQLIRVYLATAVIYGVLALVLAVPLGVLGAHGMAVLFLDLLNITVDSFQVDWGAVALQIGVGVGVPIVGALIPVIGGARMTAHEAIDTHGISMDFGENWFDKLIGRIHSLPRPFALSLRNTFRHKARVALTLITLTLSGVMFVMTESVGDSFINTLDMVINQSGEDVQIIFDEPYRAERLLDIAQSVPGVLQAEVWHAHWGTLSLPSGEDVAVSLDGVPEDSAVFNPAIVAGRSFLLGDGRAVLVENGLMIDEGVAVGDQVTLSIMGEEAEWTVVGAVLDRNSMQHDFYVPLNALAQATGDVGMGTEVKVVCGSEDMDVQLQFVDALRTAYAANCIEVLNYYSMTQLREQNIVMFNVMIYMLLCMAIVAAVVGSMGLMSTMSINVLERTREIGVMRAVGGSSRSVVGIFVGEGIVLGVLSWLLALPLSIPGARLMCAVVGNMVLNFPLEFVYSIKGLFIWLLIVIVLSALASLVPALRATRVSVREALTYE